jgi:hypothetical protein
MVPKWLKPQASQETRKCLVRNRAYNKVPLRRALRGQDKSGNGLESADGPLRIRKRTTSAVLVCYLNCYLKTGKHGKHGEHGKVMGNGPMSLH